ncbi:MAG TPA: hypothetical protein PLZ57_03150 [Pseudobdellovibrionaceae bacterium]|nr:hypothetical protein [Pseudobdellovibrionaceae bacterium]
MKPNQNVIRAFASLIFLLSVLVQNRAEATSAVSLLNDYGKDTAQMRSPGRHATRSELFEAPGPARSDGFDLLRASPNRALAIRCEEGWDGPRVWQYRDAVLSEAAGDDKGSRHLRYQFQNLDECFKARDALSATREAGCRVRIDFAGGQPKGTARFRGVECDTASAGATIGSAPQATPRSTPSSAAPQPTRTPRISR